MSVSRSADHLHHREVPSQTVTFSTIVPGGQAAGLIPVSWHICFHINKALRGLRRRCVNTPASRTFRDRDTQRLSRRVEHWPATDPAK